MAKNQGMDPEKVILDALGYSDKDFSDLTTEEARSVIKHLHSIKGA